MNWEARIRLITVVNNPEDEIKAKEFLKSLTQLARLPQTLTEVYLGSFEDIVTKAPTADINIFGMHDALPYDFIKDMSKKTNSSCLFVRDSGHESILA